MEMSIKIISLAMVYLQGVTRPVYIIQQMKNLNNGLENTGRNKRRDKQLKIAFKPL